MKQIIYLFIISLFSISSFAQNKYEVLSEHYEDNTSLIRIKINDEPIINENGGYGFKIKTAINYTSFSIGWLTNSDNALPKDFLVVYKVHKPDIGWSDWKTDDGNTSPNQTATQAYYSDLLFGVDEWLHDSIEFYIHPPEGTELTEFQMVLQDISSSIKLIMPETEDTSGAKSCPEFPNIILRSEWCGSYSACHNPTYSVTYRNATHTVIHHGASPDNYTDGAAVIRSYWNYHVNTHGWADIGYNYLFDKYGNFFLGRHNPNYPFQDVHAAHAGNANTYSIGLNFLGDSDSPNTAPTEPQLQKCAQFLAWWYDYKTFDPQSSASILNQAGNQWLNLPRICGHRDVNPGGTTCPGNALYQLLPNLRNRTTQVLADCNILPDTEPPTSEIIIERKWQNSKFDVQFIDEDNLDGSGVKYSFYQIMDFDSQEWRANANNGFFNDNFNSAIHPEWTQASGDWTISEQHLKQSEQTSANTNLYANLTQVSGEIYLYHWQQKISGTGSNRRSGMHIFCSDPDQTGRENSYMIYLRADNNTVQIYKYIDNSYSSNGGWYTTDDFTINADTWYDVKMIVNTNSGEISVYINNTLAAIAIDDAPLSSGNYISLRTGQCITEYDDVKVYKARGNNVEILPANSADADIRYQSPNENHEAGRIRTILIDNANNWSESVSENIFVDWTKPQTEINANENWYNSDFDAQFTDTDDLSEIEKGFYSVSDFNGSKWSSNQNNGFAFNEFSAEIGSEWTAETGTWIIENNALTQTNESNGNTNIWTYIQHDLSNKYIYEFDMKIEGNDANKRAGFHFFSDNPSLENRGNGYFIWFRLQSKDLEFYKVIDDAFAMKKYYHNIDITAEQWYNVKLIYDRITGETLVYLNNEFVGEYTDPNPYSTGNYISFRSGNSKLSIKNFAVYRSRYPEASISMGDNNSDIRYQNASPNAYAAKIYSYSIDSAKNISARSEKSLKIDWTAPPAVANINDGLANDIDLTEDLNQLSGNWAATNDPNSGIAAYYYAIGTTQGGTQTVNWTNNGLNTSFTKNNLNLIPETTYYISVKAKNGAGLYSDISNSNGVKAIIVPNCPSDIEICVNSQPITLSGASPNGGIYSGSGVSGGVFNPTNAGIGTHTISYTIGSQFCEFNIVVNPQPELICPEDIYLSSNSETLQLNEASPNGGIYSLNGNEISEFNPNDYEDGTYTINYFYEDSETGCQANCSFNIYIYSATEINCPNDLNICIDDASFLMGGATPPGGNYFINQQEITDFNPALWGVGTHTVSYFYEDAECDFQIIVNELPDPICPDDLIVEDTLEVFTLTGGQPESGWYEINGSEITEFNPQTMSPDTYYITYLYENPETNCIGSCVFSITLNSTVAIESLELTKLQIFPNPNTGNFQVRIYDGFGENSIKVYELNGKLVYENKIQINNDTELLKLNLNLASGLYFVKLTNSNNSIIEKLIVE